MLLLQIVWNFSQKSNKLECLMSREICEDAANMQEKKNKHTIKPCSEKSEQVTCMQPDNLSTNTRIICLQFICYHCNLFNRLMHTFHSPSIFFWISSFWTIWFCSSLRSADQIHILYGCRHILQPLWSLKQ